MNPIGKFPGKLVLGLAFLIVGSAGSAMAGDALHQKLVQQGKSCISHRDESCAKVCMEAVKTQTDAALVNQCNTEYQRVTAAHPPRAVHAEENMSLEARIALMADKAAYCKSRLSNSLPRGTRRTVEVCVGSCSDTRVGDKVKYPLNRRTDLVRSCENVYYGVVDLLGK